jgi:hypothetical protein
MPLIDPTAILMLNPVGRLEWFLAYHEVDSPSDAGQAETLRAVLKHCIVVPGCLRYHLQDIPVLDNFPIAVESKDIDSRVVLLTWPLLVAVQDDVVTISECPFEVDSLARVLGGHPLAARVTIISKGNFQNNRPNSTAL